MGDETFLSEYCFRSYLVYIERGLTIDSNSIGAYSHKFQNDGQFYCHPSIEMIYLSSESRIQFIQFDQYAWQRTIMNSDFIF